MGFEIFKIKSLSLNDSIVRGSRIGVNNSETTRTVEIGKELGDVVRFIGEDKNAEYLIESSVRSNELTLNVQVTNGDDKVTILEKIDGIKITEKDRFRFGKDQIFYSIKEVKEEEKEITLSQNYQGDTAEGTSTIRKNKLDSLNIDIYKNKEDYEDIYYDKDKTRWKIDSTKVIEPDHREAINGEFKLDKEPNEIFAKFIAAPGNTPDIVSMDSVKKTILNNNKREVLDVALSPIPYPHDSLQVFIGFDGQPIGIKQEFEDYVVNYSKDPSFRYPMPAYEDREVAYIKALGKLDDEVQVERIEDNFEGLISIAKEVKEDNQTFIEQVQDIISTDSFNIKVGDEIQKENRNFLINKEAGIVQFIAHKETEDLIDTVVYPQKLMWDGLSVIRGIREEDIKHEEDLVVGPISGLKDMGYESVLSNKVVVVNGSKEVRHDKLDGETVLAGDEIKFRDDTNYYTIDEISGDKFILSEPYSKEPEVTGYASVRRMVEEDEYLDIDLDDSKVTVIDGDEIVRYAGSVEVRTDDLFRFENDDKYYKVLNRRSNSIELEEAYVREDELEGIGTIRKDRIYFENKESDILVYDTDYLADYQSGAFSLIKPLKEGDSVLVSYFVEGEGVLNEILRSGLSEHHYKLKKFPVIPMSINIVCKYYDNLSESMVARLDPSSNRLKTKILNEGADYEISYITGNIYLKPHIYENMDIEELRASYNPLAQVHCILQSIPGTTVKYRVTVVDDMLEVMNASELRYKVRNPILSIIKQDIKAKPSGYKYINDLDKLIQVRYLKDDGSYEDLDIESYVYNKENKQISLSKDLNNVDRSAKVLATYTSETEELPYAPMQTFMITFKAGSNQFIIEGFDRTDVLEKDIVIRVDNLDPESTLYFIIDEVTFDGINTIVRVLGEFPEDIRSPSFYLFDRKITWKGVSDSIGIDGNIPEGENIVTLSGSRAGIVDLTRYIKPGTMVKLDGIYIHEVKSIERDTGSLSLEVYPNLFKSDIGSIEYSKLPPVLEGQATLSAHSYILDEPGEPAFKLYYISPEGSEGSGEIYIDRDKILIRETLDGLLNPHLYELKFFDEEGECRYKDLSELIEDIEDTESNISDTYPEFVKGFKPFSVTAKGKEEESFFLESKDRSTDTLLDTEDNEFQLMPYLVRVKDVLNRVRVDEIDEDTKETTEKVLDISKDYVIENGVIVLESPVQKHDKFDLSYMGLNTLQDNFGRRVTCTARYLSSFPPRTRIEVYMDYLNKDQFYVQKITERKFTELAVIPQIEEIISNASSGGMGSDSGANQSEIPNYEGGMHDLRYLIMDEEIKKELFKKFFKWYKERLRNFAAEVYLTLGFRFGNTASVRDIGDTYSLLDVNVELEDYDLTRDSEIEEVPDKPTKFFPIGYKGQAPLYYNRFGKQRLLFNEVYCCNVVYSEGDKFVIIKSERPYWANELDFKNIKDSYNSKLIQNSQYEVDIKENDRLFRPPAGEGTYSFLRTLEKGDEVSIEDIKGYYSINEIRYLPGDVDEGGLEINSCEYLKLSGNIKGLRTFKLGENNIPEDEESLVRSLPSNGFNVQVKRKSAEVFPVIDDKNSFGATAIGESVEGHIKDRNRIRKPFFGRLFGRLFGAKDDGFIIHVRVNPESAYEILGSINFDDELNFREIRNINSIINSLNFDFRLERKFQLNKTEDSDHRDNKGLHHYFYVSFERVYDVDRASGYRESIILRAKNRDWQFRIVGSDDLRGGEDYGFMPGLEYKGFYESDNLYKHLLYEGQAWETEHKILKDLFDNTDRLARAYERGSVSGEISRYKGYLQQISEVLEDRITSYSKIIGFLASNVGPTGSIVKEDGDYSKKSFNTSTKALDIYRELNNLKTIYYKLNSFNSNVWEESYIRWVLGISKGIIHQDVARGAIVGGNELSLGLYEFDAVRISTASNDIKDAQLSIVEFESSVDFLSRKRLLLKFKYGSEEVIAEINLYVENKDDDRVYIEGRKISDVVNDINNVKHGSISNIFKAEDILNNWDHKGISDKLLTTVESSIGVDGFILKATNVNDHRNYDPRILYLNRNIEDRLYTDDNSIREGLSIEYTKSFHKSVLSEETISISPSNTVAGRSISEIRSEIKFLEEDKEYVKSLTVVVVYTKRNIFPAQSTSFESIEVTLNIDDKITIETLVDYLKDKLTINREEFVTVGIRDNKKDTKAMYLEEGEKVSDVNKSIVLSTDIPKDIDSPFNGFTYRIYHDKNFRKKLEIRFGTLVLDGFTYRPVEGGDTTYIIELQRDDGEYIALSDLKGRIEELGYFNVIVKENIKTNLLIADNIPRFSILNEPTIVNIDENLSVSRLRSTEGSVSSVFTFPRYTSNGNPNKDPIDGIPVAGTWASLEPEGLLTIKCKIGNNWGVYIEDNYEEDGEDDLIKRVLGDIDTTGTAELGDINNIDRERPSVSINRQLVLIAYSPEGTIEYLKKYNLRKYRTIGGLKEAINDSFDEDGFSAFEAALVGSETIVSRYKSYEMLNEYEPMVRSFRIIGEDTERVYYNRLIGWIPRRYNYSSSGATHTLRSDVKRYSKGDRFNFIVKSPSEAYLDISERMPQSFREDILAFKIYSCEDGGSFEIKNDRIIFNSKNISNYEINLAGSGGIRKEENLNELLKRINNDGVLNKVFFADLSFTRDSDDSGHFEYGYLPNQDIESLEKSERIDFNLRNENILRIAPNSSDGYRFLSSMCKVDKDSNNLNLECSWEKDIDFNTSYEFDRFNTYRGLRDRVNNDRTINIENPLFELDIEEEYLGKELSKYPLLNLSPESLDTGEVELYANIDKEVPVSGGTTEETEIVWEEKQIGIIKLKNIEGSNFEVRKSSCSVVNRGSLKIKYRITYKDEFSASLDLLNYATIEDLIGEINSLTQYNSGGDTFGNLFEIRFSNNIEDSNDLVNFYKNLESERLMDFDGVIGDPIAIRLDDIPAISFLTLRDNIEIQFTGSDLIVREGDSEIHHSHLKEDGDINEWIRFLRNEGMDRPFSRDSKGLLEKGVIAIQVNDNVYGRPEESSKKVSTEGSYRPHNVYFGILGDIEFVQTSDINIYRQYNWVKKRLGKPWSGEEDYYTREDYSSKENNPHALNSDRVYKYIKQDRMSEVKSSIEEEKLIINKYLWLYMMHHKEFGCYPKALALRNQIEKEEGSVDTLQHLL